MVLLHSSVEKYHKRASDRGANIMSLISWLEIATAKTGRC